MVLPAAGQTISFSQMAAEYGVPVTGPVSMSQMYRGAGVVTENSGSNLAVPVSGAISFDRFHGNVGFVQALPPATVSVAAAYSAMTPVQQAAFRADAVTRMAAYLNLPASAVTVTSVTGAGVITFAFTIPATGTVNAAVLAKITALAAETSPTAVFGSAFCTTYAVTGSLAAAPSLPPALLLGGSKTLSVPTAAVTAVSIADLFSSTKTPLTYALAGTTPYGNASIAGAVLSVSGYYRGATYPVYVRATDSAGNASASASVVATEPAPPAIVATAVPAVTGLANAIVVVPIAGYFADPLGMTLTYAVTGDPYASGFLSGTGVGAGTTLSVCGANRGATYGVVVRASNVYGAATSATVAVTEVAGPTCPTVTKLLVPLSGVALTTNAVSYTLSSYFAGTSLTFAVTSNPKGSAAIAAGVLTVTGFYRESTYGVVVTATTSGGGTNSQTLTVTEAVAGTPTATSMGSATLTNTTQTYWLASYFADPQGAALSYAITAGNAYGNSYLSGGYLYVPAAFRNASYGVTVTATNPYGKAVTSTASITEQAGYPTVSASFGGVSLTNTTPTYWLASYFSDPQGSALSYSITAGNPYGSAYLSGGYLYVPSAYRNTNYTITVTATNIYAKSVSNTMTVYEAAQPVPTFADMGTITILSSLSQTITLSNYLTDYSGTSITYNVMANPKSNVTLSGGILTIKGAGRNTTYTITVKATNGNNQSVSSSVNVYEPWPAPTLRTPFVPLVIAEDLAIVYMTDHYTSLDSLNIYLTYASPYNAWVSGDLLYIQGARIGATYNVTFQVYDSYGQTATTVNLSVTEYAPQLNAVFNHLAFGWAGYSGSSGWNCIDSGVTVTTWGDMRHPIFIDNDPDELTFHYYVQFGGLPTVSVKSNKIYLGGYAKYQFSYWLRSSGYDLCTFTTKCVFYKANGLVMDSIGANSTSSNQTWTSMWMSTTKDMSQVTYAIITLTGYDNSGFYGYHGMRYANVMIDGQ